MLPDVCYTLIWHFSAVGNKVQQEVCKPRREDDDGNRKPVAVFKIRAKSKLLTFILLYCYIAKQLKMLSNMDKYHHTAIRVRKRKNTKLCSRAGMQTYIFYFY